MMETVRKEYVQGNMELLTMIRSKSFDRATAERVMSQITDLNDPVLDLDGYETTYLFEAESYNNIEAVRFLLENGADPNLDIPDLINSCALVDLHFLWEEMGEEADIRLKIAKLFFDFGADPNLWYDGETLYDHVLWEIFTGDIPHDWEYLKRFFLLLVAYGGGEGKSNNYKPMLTEPIDKERIWEYDFKMVQCEDGYHLEGHIINPDGRDIGIV